MLLTEQISDIAILIFHIRENSDTQTLIQNS